MYASNCVQETAAAVIAYGLKSAAVKAATAATVPMPLCMSNGYQRGSLAKYILV